jgi:trehalose 6-phosphate phosphatase
MMIETRRTLPEPSPGWALFLDVDGTLLDIAPSPSLVEVPPGLPGLLERLARLLDGALALVSGRSLADLDRLFGPLPIAMAGQHGAEIRRPGHDIEIPGAANDALSGLLPEIEAYARARAGLLVENKGRTIAVHYRMAPEFARELGRFLTGLIGDHAGLEIVAGLRVFELRARGADKGAAIRHLMQSAPFTGRLPVFIGDDTTDEDGFAAVLRRGGHAIRVGFDGDSLASCRIADVAGVRAFLARTAARLGQ